jgi:hypothetical protein
MRFLPKTTKNVRESEFDIDKIPRIHEQLYIDAKIRENHLLKSHFCDFLLQYTIRLP